MNPRTAALAAAALFLASAPAAQGAPWARVTTPDGSSVDQPGIARTSDGVLHVVWHRPTGPNTEDLLHTPISPAGKVGTATPVQSGWTGFSNPAVVIDPSGGLRAFWGGFRSTDSSDPQREINTALSTDGGATWALQPGAVNPGGAQSYASPIAATVRGGEILQAWAGTLGTWVHSGLSPATPNFEYQYANGLGQYGNDPNLATDADGMTMLAWYSSGTGNLGVKVQGVAPGGAPAGPVRTMPDTDDLVSGSLSRTPFAARPGGGFYAAYATGYPAHDRVRIWRVGDSRARGVAKLGPNGNAPVAVAGAADGRMWVAWVDNRNGKPTVRAVRSNRRATVWGATVSGGAIRNTQAAYDLDASAAPGGGLDLLANFNDGTSSVTATWHRRLSPGLSLSTARAGRGEVRFTVRDAGDPVRGAKVRIGGRRGTTNGRGRVVLDVRRAGRATATKTGYVKATKRVTRPR